MVHRLQQEDSRLFRCDVLGEVVQWNVDTDKDALGFIVGLHDMWSRTLVQKEYEEPWWVSDQVVTIREARTESRRLTEIVGDGEGRDSKEGAKKAVKDGKSSKSKEDEVAVVKKKKKGRAGTTGSKVVEGAKDEGAEEQGHGAKKGASSKKAGVAATTEGQEGDEADSEDQGDEEISADQGEGTSKAFEVETEKEKHVEETGAFGGKGGESDTPPVIEDKKLGVAGEDATSGDEDDDAVQGEPTNRGDIPDKGDVSSYDKWMGVLSSKPMYYFVRIVPSSEVGVLYLEDYAIE